MAGISFSKEARGIWIVAGWAFREVLRDVLNNCPEDSEMAAKFDEAEARGFLHVEYLDSYLAARVAKCIREVATGVLGGTVRSGIVERFPDKDTIQEYRKGLQMLLEATQAFEEQP
jgi:hypothetical protein